MSKKSHSLSRVVCALALMTAAGSAVAASMPSMSRAEVQVVQKDQSTSLMFGGSVFHTTMNPVTGLRTLAGPAGEAIIVWNEHKVGGEVSPFYAVSLDGRTIAGRVREASYAIDLKFARFDPLVDGEPAMHPLLRAGASNDQYLVQFWAPPTDSMRWQIEMLGGSVERYFAGGIHVVRMSEAASQAVASLPYVRWVGEHHVAYRADDLAREILTANISSNEEQRWHINVYRQGAQQQGAVEALIKAMGGTVHYTQPDLFRMEATLTPVQLLQVLHMNEVEYVDPWLGEGGHDMDIGRELLGSNFVQSGGRNYSGQGVRGQIFDTELCMTHVEWRNPPILHSLLSTGSSHGTSCFGICFAQGISATHKGHMPDGQGIFFRFNEATSFGGNKTRLQIAQEATNPALQYQSVFQTSSVGNPQVPNYTALSAEMDTVIFQTGYLHCQSQSNTGNQNSRPEAWAKNMVSGGAVQHNNNPNLNTHTQSGASIGPSPEGRIKPDLAGFYDNIATTSLCAYTSGFGGTSGGTPMVCGTMGIFFQMWHEGVWPGRGGLSTVFESRALHTTAKAAMINTSYRYPQLNRFRQGWGLPDLRKLWELRNKTVIIDGDDPVEHLEIKSYSVNVDVGEPELNVVMSYREPAGALSPAAARVNDLSLRVISPSGTMYWGNNGLTAGNWSTAGGNSNTVDTVEAVFVQNPEAGSWTIEIHGDEVTFDTEPNLPGTQAGFSMWVTGATGGPAPLSVRFAMPPPTQVDPGVDTVMDVLLREGSDTLVPGSAQLFYRFGPETWQSTPLVQINGEEWQATLPAAGCTQEPDFYLIAEGVNTGVRTNPAGAPANFYSVIVGELETGDLVNESFEAGLPAGWTLTGLWNIANSCASGQSCAGTRWLYYGITGQCNYNNGAHNFGSATSPIIDLPTLPWDGSITLEYCMSKVTEGSTFFDRAEVLFNGQLIDAPPDSQAWTTRVIDLSAFAGQSGRLEFKFDTRDANRNNFRGWLVDGVRLSYDRRVCEDGCYPDCDQTTGPGVLDIFDFLCFGNKFDQGDPYACDCDVSTGPGVCDIFDFLCFGNAFDQGCP